MWFFPVLGFALEEKLCGAKCCKYFRPEGVLYIKRLHETKNPTIYSIVSTNYPIVKLIDEFYSWSCETQCNHYYVHHKITKT